MILITLMLGSIACGAERSMADGFAAAGAAQAANGKTEQAKDLLYKALVYDDSCPDALFELAKIMDKENNPLALAFFQRAASLYEKESKPTPAKKSEAEKRLKALDAYGPRLSVVMEEYALELDKIVKKIPDDATRDAASERVGAMVSANLLHADKMPKFYNAAAAAKPTKGLQDSKEIGGVWHLTRRADRAWQCTLDFDTDGTFQAVRGKESGKWSMEGNVLVMDWKKWGIHKLKRIDKNTFSDDIDTIKRQ
ncbi:MAG: hypothetical protein WCN98_10100 [Verrucomicrobiaceae bacterium]